MERNLTVGSVPKNLLYFALPYLLSYFLQTLYGMADLFIVGQFAPVAATTAVSIGSQVMHMLTVVLVGLAMGTTVQVAQAVGGGNRAEASRAIGNTVTLFAGVTVALTVLLVALVRPIVAVMYTPAEAVEGTVAYLTVCFLGIPFITAYNILSAIFRGMGDSESPLYFIAMACGVNIGLDYLFIGALDMGPVGAALGTTLSQAVSVGIALLFIWRRKIGPWVGRSDLRPVRPVMGRLLSIGLPIALQDGLIQVAFMVITVIANRRGLTDSAAVGIVEKIIGFLFLVPSSMLSTVSALGAQNIGAGKPERAEATLRYALLITGGFGAVMAVLFQWAATGAVALFTPDTAVAIAGGTYLRGYILDCAFAGIHFSFSGYFCARGKSGLSFLHNLLAIVLVRIPGAYIASLQFPDTLLPMGLATAAGSLFSAIVCLIAFAVIRRQDRQAAAKANGGQDG